MGTPEFQYNKVLYQRSQRKRYEISRDAFSKERISVLRELQAELSEKLPVSLSITVMGSLLKGKKLDSEETAENTDMDLFVHIDKEELNNLSDDQLKHLRSVVGVDDSISLPEIRGKLLDFIYNYIKSGINVRKHELGYKGEAKVDIAIDFADSFSIERGVLNVKMADYGIVFAPEAEHLLIEAYVTLASYFLPAAGKVSVKYRNKFLLQLFQDPEKEHAQEQWRTVYKVITRVEDAFDAYPLLANFPYSLEEALEFYKVKTIED